MKTKVDTVLPIEFSEVCEVVWEDVSASTVGRTLKGAFAQAIIQGGTFDSNFVGSKDRLQNFRGYEVGGCTAGFQFNYASTALSVDDGTIAQPWLNLSDLFDPIKPSDATAATCLHNFDTITDSSEKLYCQGFNFNIPTSNVVIDRIVVQIRRWPSHLNSITDYWFYIIKEIGTGVTGRTTLGQKRVSGYWNITPQVVTYVWESPAITPAEINNPLFGVELGTFNENATEQVTAFIDYISVRVEYSCVQPF